MSRVRVALVLSVVSGALVMAGAQPAVAATYPTRDGARGYVTSNWRLGYLFAEKVAYPFKLVGSYAVCDTRRDGALVRARVWTVLGSPKDTGWRPAAGDGLGCRWYGSSATSILSHTPYLVDFTVTVEAPGVSARRSYDVDTPMFECSWYCGYVPG